MESGLPEEYQDEQELEKQRSIHDQLITKGMEVITDSYLDIPKLKCKKLGIPFLGKSLEGKNWVELVKDINEADYDLIVMGIMGLGSVRDSQIGTVTNRVIRRIQTDTLLVKHLPELDTERSSSGKIVVAIDGSGHSFGGLKTGIELAKLWNRPLEIIATFDPYFHYAMFNSLAGVLSKEASKVFKLEQQEKLHEEIIDKGLAKIYQAHLEVSKKVAEEEGVSCTIRLLDGKVYEKILQYTREENPFLLIMGRIGVHSAPEMDIGGNTENLIRFVPCNVYLSSRVFKPKIDTIAEEIIEWTAEAKERLEKIPGFVRPMATSAILRYAMERGHSMITSSLITEACENILPAGSMEAMGAIGQQVKEKAKMENLSDPYASVDPGMLKDQMMAAHAGKAPSTIKIKCTACGTVMGEGAIKCGVCNASKERLLPITDKEASTNFEEEGGVSIVTSFDSKNFAWTHKALERLEIFSPGHVRQKAKARVEKNARSHNISTITLDFLNDVLDLDKLSSDG
jgi:nucleotide-binding universal stress UspA family protein